MKLSGPGNSPANSALAAKRFVKGLVLRHEVVLHRRVDLPSFAQVNIELADSEARSPYYRYPYHPPGQCCHADLGPLRLFVCAFAVTEQLPQLTPQSAVACCRQLRAPGIVVDDARGV